MVINLFNSFNDYAIIHECRTSEREWHLGTDTFAASPNQVLISEIAINQLISSYELINGPIPQNVKGITRSFAYLPFFAAAAETYVSKETYPKTYSCVRSLSYNLGTVSTVIYIAASIYLGISKGYRYLATSLSGYTLAAIIYNEHTPIPRVMLNTIGKVAYYGFLITELYNGKWLTAFPFFLIGASTFEFGARMFESYLLKKGSMQQNLSSGEDKKLEEIGALKLEVNNEYLKFKTERKDPCLYSDFTCLVDGLRKNFEKINWENLCNKNSLFMCLEADDKWLQLVDKSQKNAKKFLTEGLDIFLHRMKEKAAYFQAPFQPRSATNR